MEETEFEKEKSRFVGGLIIMVAIVFLLGLVIGKFL